MSKKIYKDLDLYLENNVNETELKKEIDRLVYQNSPAIKTISTRYSLIKTYLKKNYDGLSNEFISSVKAPDEITKTLLNEGMEKRQAKTNFIFNEDDINKILSLRDSNNSQDIAIYLQFISGRRASEIYQHADDHDIINLTRIKNKPNVIKFSNLHKKKSNNKNNTNEIVHLIPGTLDSKEFKNLYNKLKNLLNDISTQDAINRVNKRIKFLFPNIKKISSHNLRGMYAQYMYSEHNPDQQNINGYITKILNHDSPESSLSYSNYKYEKNKILDPDRKIKKKQN